MFYELQVPHKALTEVLRHRARQLLYTEPTQFLSFSEGYRELNARSLKNYTCFLSTISLSHFLTASLAAHVPFHSHKCPSLPVSSDGMHFISKIPAWKSEAAWDFCCSTATVLQHSNKAWVSGSQRIYIKTKGNPGSLRNHPEHIK